ncbi:hypothetical protein LEP1GSC074_2276 [Leptospira noguchii str. Hook]|uniref:Uncharacterized protein n=1 Tax=Leptospira noguchii serovar Autumnalis str. ZUN142 TaxID=1085540 RepID=M6UMY1_9LEPT|nr:hypothetical protein LEP1GSC041_1783 [Leptospira noguchii str. 2006001870]EMO30351.1 hypothetical protein LEP1GSC170_2741 [Leptospira interrogans serovar Bataviae str. HAI135]EMO42414.1 hypothetical protein LEP1GSC186_1624 [Leptospira noguchii serovar Autumnalis str. ZUN142]EMS86685.1 hypothetical protein LEP1GSC074_2276 [Leptospira noguchii str. Hook]
MIRILSKISLKVKATKAIYIFQEKISILIQGSSLDDLRIKTVPKSVGINSNLS